MLVHGAQIICCFEMTSRVTGRSNLRDLALILGTIAVLAALYGGAAHYITPLAGFVALAVFAPAAARLVYSLARDRAAAAPSRGARK